MLLQRKNENLTPTQFFGRFDVLRCKVCLLLPTKTRLSKWREEESKWQPRVQGMIMQKCRLISENWKFWELFKSWKFLHLLVDDLLHYNFLPFSIKIISKNLTHTTIWKNVEVGEVDNVSSNIKASPELNHHEMVIIQHEKEAGNSL